MDQLDTMLDASPVIGDHVDTALDASPVAAAAPVDQLDAMLDASPEDTGALSAPIAAPVSDRVNMLDSQGQLVNVHKGDIQRAYDQGFRLDLSELGDSKITHVKLGDKVNTLEVGSPEFQQAMAEGGVLANPNEVAQEYGDAGSQVGAGVEGFLQGGTAGLYGLAADAVMGDDYTKERELRAQYNPITSGIGEVGGMIASTLAMPALGAPGNAMRGAALAKAAGQTGARAVLTRVAGEALAGATEAGLYGLVRRSSDTLTGDHDFDAENVLLGAGRDALIGGAAGAVMKGVGELGSAAVKRMTGNKTVEQAIDSMANEQAFRAINGNGNRTGVNRAIADFGEGGPEELGKFALDSGILGETRSMDDILRNATAIKEQAGSEVGAAIRSAVDPNVLPDTRKIADQIREGVIQPMLNDPAKRRYAKMVQEKLDDVLGDLDMAPGDPNKMWNTTEDLWNGRRSLDDTINWARKANANEVEEQIMQARNIIEDGITEQIGNSVVQRGGLPEEAQAAMNAYKAAKLDYRKATAIQGMAEKQAIRDLSNRQISLTDYVMADAGADFLGDAVGQAAGSFLGHAVGGVAGMAGMALINRVIRNQGPAFTANAMRRLGKLSKAVSSGRSISESASRNILSSLERGSTLLPLDDQDGPEGADLEKLLTDSSKVVSGQTADLDGMTEVMAAVHGPDVANAARQNAINGAQFLYDKATQLDNKGPTAQRRLVRYATAIKDPARALDRLASLSATREDVEVLQSLYPKTFQAIARQVQVGMQDAQVKGKDIDRNRLRRVQSLLGMPSKGPSPQFIQSLTQPAAEESPKAPSNRARPANTSYADRAMTGQQSAAANLRG